MATIAKHAAKSAAASAAAALASLPKGRAPRASVMTGVVTRAGLCDKTVRIQVTRERWNAKVKKFFPNPQHHLVHDPNNSLRAGDIIEVQSSWRTSKTKRFVVNKIVAPFGEPIEARPPVPTPDQREETKAAQRAAKLARRDLRRTRERLENSFTNAMRKIQNAVKEAGLENSPLKKLAEEQKRINS